ncbi:Uncharacterised protein [Legionella lansingensis]|uniref:F-box domain-containing protein n=1 Tax=Legionella lansingensis TaxID=45067 RepID=A0A0W0VV93_9GAMM|nr:hypothetical protein [Legionella lansingensis]KTD23821.1 hypothetical protein Llan_0602 [Legionella lansingensis]SNV46850.1 Uncharacterised protein [Legionella lansingensis]
MRKRTQNVRNENPFNQLPDEMVLSIFNVANKHREAVLKPNDMTSVALSCERFKNVSSDASFFSHNKYRHLREQSSDYRDFKEKQIRKLRRDMRWEKEKNGDFYYDKNTRHALACFIGLAMAGGLALKLDTTYPTFLFLFWVFCILNMIINEVLLSYFEPSLNPNDLRKIPLQFYEEQFVINNNKP